MPQNAKTGAQKRSSQETGRPKILMYSVSQNITDNQKEQMSQFKSVHIRENNYWIDYEGCRVTLDAMIRGYINHLNLHFGHIHELL